MTIYLNRFTEEQVFGAVGDMLHGTLVSHIVGVPRFEPQLPANLLSKNQQMTILVTHAGDPDGVPSSSLWPGLALAAVGI